MFIDFSGISSPKVDIIAILKNALLYNQPLYMTQKPRIRDNITTDLQNFSKLMGWEWDDVLPKKREAKKERKDRGSLLDFKLENRETKTDVRKEMKDSVLVGIEQKISVEKLPERKLAKLRKVINEWCGSAF